MVGLSETLKRAFDVMEAAGVTVDSNPRRGSNTTVSSAANVDQVVNTPIASLADHSPDEWEDEFLAWFLDRCTHREHYDDGGGLSTLHRDFSGWLIDRGSVPCNRATFETLITDAGFPIDHGMVRGVVLTMDLLSWLRDQAKPPQTQTGTQRGRRIL